MVSLKLHIFFPLSAENLGTHFAEKIDATKTESPNTPNSSSTILLPRCSHPLPLLSCWGMNWTTEVLGLTSLAPAQGLCSCGCSSLTFVVIISCFKGSFPMTDKCFTFFHSKTNRNLSPLIPHIPIRYRFSKSLLLPLPSLQRMIPSSFQLHHENCLVQVTLSFVFPNLRANSQPLCHMTSEQL